MREEEEPILSLQGIFWERTGNFLCRTGSRKKLRLRARVKAGAFLRFTHLAGLSVIAHLMRSR